MQQQQRRRQNGIVIWFKLFRFTEYDGVVRCSRRCRSFAQLICDKHDMFRDLQADNAIDFVDSTHRFWAAVSRRQYRVYTL